MLKRFRQRMKQEGIEVFCVTDQYDALYLFGEELSGYIFITQDEVVMILPRAYRFEDLDRYETHFVFSREEYEDKLESLEYDQVHSREPEKIDDYFEVKESDLLKEMRIIKTDEEIEKMKKAAEITDGAIKNLKDDLVGITEFEGVKRLQSYYADRCVQESFLTNRSTSLVQRNSLLPHRTPEDKKIEPEDLVIVDTGARYKGYCADISRTYCENPSERQLNLLNSVREIQRELIDMVEPGVEISKFKEKEFELVEKKGYDPEENVIYFSHSIGLQTHEFVSLSHTSDSKFQEGMIVTVEPGIHVEELGGVRFEEMIVVRKDGAEVISHAPYEL